MSNNQINLFSIWLENICGHLCLSHEQSDRLFKYIFTLKCKHCEQPLKNIKNHLVGVLRYRISAAVQLNELISCEVRVVCPHRDRDRDQDGFRFVSCSALVRTRGSMVLFKAGEVQLCVIGVCLCICLLCDLVHHPVGLTSSQSFLISVSVD